MIVHPRLDLSSRQNYSVLPSTNDMSEQKTGRREIADNLSDLPKISLQDTNRKSKMLSRIDNKYLLNRQQFDTLLNSVKEHYAVMEIDGPNQFSYASCYYDDHFVCYYQHHQARRQRFKVRTREYLDCGLKYFEIKLKGLRGQTNKHRIECDQLIMPVIEGEQLTLLYKLVNEQYKKTLNLNLTPALTVAYTRSTLVALAGSERVTIDYGLTFSSSNQHRNAVRINNNFIIVETKTKDGMGLVDNALRRQRIRKASKCSKYCMGLNLLGKVEKNNYFLPSLRRARQNIINRESPTTAKVRHGDSKILKGISA